MDGQNLVSTFRGAWFDVGLGVDKSDKIHVRFSHCPPHFWLFFCFPKTFIHPKPFGSVSRWILNVQISR
jgi:hypothetical protein